MSALPVDPDVSRLAQFCARHPSRTVAVPLLAATEFAVLRALVGDTTAREHPERSQGMSLDTANVVFDNWRNGVRWCHDIEQYGLLLSDVAGTRYDQALIICPSSMANTLLAGSDGRPPDAQELSRFARVHRLPLPTVAMLGASLARAVRPRLWFRCSRLRTEDYSRCSLDGLSVTVCTTGTPRRAESRERGACESLRSSFGSP